MKLWGLASYRTKKVQGFVLHARNGKEKLIS